MNPFFRMAKALRRRSEDQRGFTLIEILVVIVIIGILARIVLASLDTARARGRDTKRASDLKQMQQATENYFENSGTGYPNGTGGSFLSSQLYPTYLTSAPKDPLGSFYFYKGDASAYCIGAIFEKGIPSTLGQSASCSVSDTICDSNSSCFKVGGP